MRKKINLYFIIVTILITFLASNTINYKINITSANNLSNKNSLSLKRMPEHLWVRYKSPEGTGCREASQEEVELFTQPTVEQQDLRQINHFEMLEENYNRIEPQADGLKIVLRGTQQLENFPQAKTAFVKAAAQWEAIIKSPITVIVDVDYGPTRFGTPYPNGVIGSTRAQILGASNLYPNVRSALITTASNQQEASMYANLPVSSVPTDLGAVQASQVASAELRALNIISPIADPVGEISNFGPPPSIGFSSAFRYDFTPEDGIDIDKTDFNGVAVHEIGHLLGFNSSVGFKELAPNNTTALSVWDLFRFRPDVTNQTFATASRILSSGGTQVFFTGNQTLMLSTGRPDGSGGDGAQASHWKAKERNNGIQIGIMDPFSRDGERDQITQADMAAIDIFGYTIASSNNPADDYSLSFPQGTITLQRGKTGQFVVKVDRVGSFSGSVMITPDKAGLSNLKIKIKGASSQTATDTASFDFKVKKAAPTGNQQLLFVGVDNSGRVRQATLNLVIN